jgi:hypothetical protein
MQGLAEPICSLIVLLLDHAPSPEEIRRIQAHFQQREDLTLSDQQQQFADCWQARAGLRESDRLAAVCADLGISAKRAHNLRRQLSLPERIRTRVAERPAGEQISVTMANKLADMHDLAPQLTEAVAKRITTGDLHAKALRDLGAFVHRTVAEDEHTYAVRIDDGARLDAAEQIDHARGQLSDSGRRHVGGILGCEPERLDRELDTLAARAKSRALKLHITGEVPDRARNGRYAFVHDRGRDFAAGVWVVDPAFMIDLVHEQIQEDDTAAAREEAYLAGARIDDDELRDAAAEDEQPRAQARARQAEATRSNLGLGHDIRAGLIQPTRPAAGDRAAHRPARRRLYARPRRRLAHQGARVRADGAQAPRRPARRESALRASVWELMRPMLSPALVSLNRDAFVVQDERERPSTSPAARPPRASTTSTSTSSTAQPHRNGREGPRLARRLRVFSFCLAGRSSTPGRSSGGLGPVLASRRAGPRAPTSECVPTLSKSPHFVSEQVRTHEQVAAQDCCK